jgi:xylulokinase
VTVVLGLDLGTSQVKALVRAADGTVLHRSAAAYPVSTPRDGWAETNPEQWWLAVRTAIGALGPARAEVRAIALAGQMHGLVLSSERAVALRPAILWLDRRATAEAADYPGSPQVLGNPPSPGMAGPLLLWLSRHEPDAYRQARWQLQPKDWLRLRLTGDPATDPSDASGTLLYDLAADAWAADVVRALGLNPDLLPPVRASAEVAGTLLPGPARDLGLRPGIPVAVGAADTAASLLAAGTLAAGSLAAGTLAAGALAAGALAAGALAAGSLAGGGGQRVLLTVGSGGQWIAPAAPLPDPTGRTNLFRCAGPGTYRLAPAQNVGVTLDWVRRLLAASWDELYATAARQPAEPAPVFRPRLTAERWEEPGAAGAWSGLTLAHQREDLMRAALLGVAGLLRERLDDLRTVGCDPAHVLTAGGGIRDPAWRQLLAEVLGVPLTPAPTSWLTATGACLLAATAAGPH